MSVHGFNRGQKKVGIQPTELIAIQNKLGLSDNKMAAALGITRQTWRNWRTGKAMPDLAANAIRWLMELRRLSPANDNIPERMRFFGAIAVAILAPLLHALDSVGIAP